MKKRVLVFPCGSQPAVDINFALRYSLQVDVFGASSVEDHGKYIYKRYFGGLPNISEENFIDEFNKILIENNIDFVIPTHDTVALFLMENENKIASKIISSDLETTKICRYKSLTYSRLSHYDFIPKIYTDIQRIDEFPVFLKPDAGQGGQGTYIAHNVKELNYYLSLNNDLLLCEYLPGEEITVDCFTDRFRELRVISPRVRSRTLAGISVNSKLIAVDNEIRRIAYAINRELKFRGYWYFQLKRNKEGKYKLLEISTRMAGTAALSISQDINFPLLAIMDFSEEDFEIFSNNADLEVDRSLINRYRLNFEYEKVYVDLDDTLILDGKYVNQYLMMFLYQCVNNNKEINLITKHVDNVIETLTKFKISKDLFNSIIHIKNEDHKYKYIDRNTKSIFIDNSFTERKQVKQMLNNVLTFDVNNVDCLIDWRG